MSQSRATSQLPRMSPSRTTSQLLRRTASSATSEPPGKSLSDKSDPMREPSDKPNIELEPDTDRGVEPNIEPNPLRLFIVNNIDEDLTDCEYLGVNTHFVRGIDGR